MCPDTPRLTARPLFVVLNNLLCVQYFNFCYNVVLVVVVVVVVVVVLFVVVHRISDSLRGGEFILSGFFFLQIYSSNPSFFIFPF